MDEFDFKKNIFGFVLTISGVHIFIALSIIDGSLTEGGLLVLIVSFILAIAGLCLMETLVKGSALIYGGILMLVCYLIVIGAFIHRPRFLLWMGVFTLIIGIILSIKGFREK